LSSLLRISRLLPFRLWIAPLAPNVAARPPIASSSPPVAILRLVLVLRLTFLSSRLLSIVFYCSSNFVFLHKSLCFVLQGARHSCGDSAAFSSSNKVLIRLGFPICFSFNSILLCLLR
jgi:hypothetical protein